MTGRIDRLSNWGQFITLLSSAFVVLISLSGCADMDIFQGEDNSSQSQSRKEFRRMCRELLEKPSNGVNEFIVASRYNDPVLLDASISYSEQRLEAARWMRLAMKRAPSNEQFRAVYAEWFPDLQDQTDLPDPKNYADLATQSQQAASHSTNSASNSSGVGSSGFMGFLGVLASAYSDAKYGTNLSGGAGTGYPANGYASASEPTNPPECKVLPPKCKQAGDRGIQFMQQVERGGISGITDAASQQYCMGLVVIEVNNLCAAEYDKLGLTRCARLSRQQAAADRDVIASAARTASAISVNNARNKCSFEK